MMDRFVNNRIQRIVTSDKSVLSPFATLDFKYKTRIHLSINAPGAFIAIGNENKKIKKAPSVKIGNDVCSVYAEF